MERWSWAFIAVGLFTVAVLAASVVANAATANAAGVASFLAILGF